MENWKAIPAVTWRHNKTKDERHWSVHSSKSMTRLHKSMSSCFLSGGWCQHLFPIMVCWILCMVWGEKGKDKDYITKSVYFCVSMCKRRYSKSIKQRQIQWRGQNQSKDRVCEQESRGDKTKTKQWKAEHFETSRDSTFVKYTKVLGLPV